MTREDWLIRAANSLSQDLLSSYPLPAFHISIGFPRGRGGRAGPLPHGALVPADRGQRPGSRLRLYECECPVKVRVAADEFHARCEDCGCLFERRGQ